jgi:hypothetical protein
MKRFVLIFLLLVQFNFCYSQLFRDDFWGIQIGLTTNFGTHINQFGIKIQGYFNYEFIQLNAGNQFLINASNLANRQNYIENRINVGAVLLAGKRNSIPTFILDGLNHQTNYDYGLGYNYLWYLDNADSYQVSGGFGFHVKQFSLLVENDVFSGNGRDRFRTSFIQLNYHNELINIKLNTQLWTGETWGTELKNLKDESYPKGYKDLRNTLYGRTSHGILSVGIDYYLFYGNSLSAIIGIDHEYIRNGLQNRFSHDKPFIPKKWRKPNVHYPMLDKYGLPVHDKSKIKRGEFLFQFGLNQPTTY